MTHRKVICQYCGHGQFIPAGSTKPFACVSCKAINTITIPTPKKTIIKGRESKRP